MELSETAGAIGLGLRMRHAYSSKKRPLLIQQGMEEARSGVD